MFSLKCHWLYLIPSRIFLPDDIIKMVNEISWNLTFDFHVYTIFRPGYRIIGYVILRKFTGQRFNSGRTKNVNASAMLSMYEYTDKLGIVKSTFRLSYRCYDDSTLHMNAHKNIGSAFWHLLHHKVNNKGQNPRKSVNWKCILKFGEEFKSFFISLSISDIHKTSG